MLGEPTVVGWEGGVSAAATERGSRTLLRMRELRMQYASMRSWKLDGAYGSGFGGTLTDLASVLTGERRYVGCRSAFSGSGVTSRGGRSNGESGASSLDEPSNAEMSLRMDFEGAKERSGVAVAGRMGGK